MEQQRGSVVDNLKYSLLKVYLAQLSEVTRFT